MVMYERNRAFVLYHTIVSNVCVHVYMRTITQYAIQRLSLQSLIPMVCTVYKCVWVYVFMYAYMYDFVVIYMCVDVRLCMHVYM